MDLTLASLAALLRLTVSNPSLAARRLMALDLDRQSRWAALALVTILSVLLVALAELALGIPGATTVIGPWTYTVILGASLVITVFVLHYVGAVLGGQGDLGDALILMAWYQMTLLALQVVQLLAILVSPFLGLLATVLSLGLALYILVNFINEMHRFGNLGRAVLTLILAVLGLGLGLGAILSAIGVGTETFT